MKIIKWLIESVFWLAIFISPVLVFGVLAFILYLGTKELKLPILTMFIGIAIGIYFAERIRRTTGCSAFLGNLIGTSAIQKNTGQKEDRRDNE